MDRQQSALRVLLVDDHDVVREGLALLLATFPGVAVLDQADNGVSALDKLKAQPQAYSLLVTDIQMPLMGGLELIRSAKRVSPDLAIIALTVDGQAATAAEALEAGAQAYMLKNSGKQVLFKAIEGALSGKTFVDEALSGDVIDYMRSGQLTGKARLSAREMEVLRCIVEELSNVQIANRLFIAERTVETHRKRIFAKTGAKSLVGLVLMARGKGWV